MVSLTPVDQSPLEDKTPHEGSMLESLLSSLSALQFPLNYPDQAMLCNFQNLTAFKTFPSIYSLLS